MVFYSQSGLHVIGGVGLLLFAIPQLPLEYSYSAHAIFSFLWVTIATLFVAANCRQMMKVKVITRLQKEKERRAMWLEARRQMPRRRKRG